MTPRTFANHLSPLERRRAEFQRMLDEQRQAHEAVARHVREHGGKPRELGPDVVDLIAVRARRR